MTTSILPDALAAQRDVLINIEYAKTASRDWHEQMGEYRALYAFEQYSRSQKKRRGEIAYEDPTYTNVVDLAVGILLANPIDFRAYGWNPDASEQKASSNIEKYLNGVLTVASRREDYDIEYETMLQFVRDGASVLYTVWDPNIAASVEGEVEIPDEQAGSRKVKALLASPARVQVIDPMGMFFLPGGPRRWKAALRTEKLPVSQVESAFGITVNAYKDRTASDKATTQCTLQDYWEIVEYVGKKEVPVNKEDGSPLTLPGGTPVTKTEYEWRKLGTYGAARGMKVGVINAILVDNQFITDPHLMQGYEDLPYTVGFFKPVSRTASKDWGHSIVHPMRSTVELLSRAINRRAYQLDVYADLPLALIGQPGRTIQMDPGLVRTVKLQQGEDMKFPTWPGNPPDFEEHIGYLRSKVQQSGFSDVMLGAGNSAASGYAMAQLGDMNSIRLEQPARNLSLMYATWAEKLLRITKNFAGENLIRVYGRMRGRAFADYVTGIGIDEFMVEYRLQAENPGEASRNHAFFIQTKGELSKATRMEKYLHIEQPDDEEDRLLEEQLLQDPLARQYAVVRLLQARAANGDKAAELMLQMQQQQLMKNQGGRPAEPNAPPQMTGVASATGDLTPQESGGQPAGQSASDQLTTMINQTPSPNG